MGVKTIPGKKRGSIIAERVAHEVLGTLGKGIMPNITEIAVKNGYAYSTANAGVVQNTQTYQRVVGNALEQFRNEREKIFQEMDRKRSKAPYASLVSGLETTSKFERLLSGQSTDNVAVGVSRLDDSELEKMLMEAESQAIAEKGNVKLPQGEAIKDKDGK